MDDHSLAATATATDSIDAVQAALDRKMTEHLARASEYSEEFRHGMPFPHLVVDDFLPEEIARRLAETFPGPESAIWTKQPTDDQRRKLATTDEGKLPPLQRYVLFYLNSGSFLRLLERITGIDDLIADTKLVGGGLHQIQSGGRLAVHIDYSHHPGNRLFRRLNLLLYVNPTWRDEFGGHLELWDEKISRCEKRIAPHFNRVALFATSEVSYHGHPDPLSTPPDLARRSLSLYYFTKEPPEGKELVEHNTSFRSRPGDSFRLGSSVVRALSSGWFRDLLPPLLYRGMRKVWGRRFTGK